MDEKFFSSAFSNLSETEQDFLKQHASIIQIPAGKIIFSENEKLDAFYIIKSGKVEILKSIETKEDTDEKTPITLQRVAIVEEQGVLGEISLLDGGKTTATVKTLEPTILIAYSTKPLLLKKNSALKQKLFFSLSTFIPNRLRNTLNLAIDTVKKKLDLEQEFNRVGHALLIGLISLCFYIWSLQILKFFTLPITLTTTMILTFLGGFLYYSVRKTKIPLSELGLTLIDWRLALKESIFFTSIFLMIMTFIKYVLISTIPKYQHEVLFHLLDTRGQQSMTSTEMMIGLLIIYAIMSNVQELIVRGFIQNLICRYFKQEILIRLSDQASEASTSTISASHQQLIRWKSIILANIIFAATHNHIALIMSIIVFIPGIFWGWLYSRHRSLLGVCFSHIVIGVYLQFVLGTQFLYYQS